MSWGADLALRWNEWEALLYQGVQENLLLLAALHTQEFREAESGKQMQPLWNALMFLQSNRCFLESLRVWGKGESQVPLSSLNQ